MSLALPSRRSGRQAETIGSLTQSPSSDVPSRVDIGMGSVPTPTTTKPRLRAAISPLDMFALRTPLTGMLGIDQLDPHASGLRLVGDKLPQLVKSPSRHASALRLAKPDPSPDALEVFEGNTPASAFSLLNDSLGEDVIGVSTEAGFF